MENLLDSGLRSPFINVDPKSVKSFTNAKTTPTGYVLPDISSRLISSSVPQVIYPPPLNSRTSEVSYFPNVKNYLSPEIKASQFSWVPPEPSNNEATDPVQDSKIRADYRVKFSILREAYPEMNIPDPDEKQTVPQIIESYKAYVKRIHIDSSVEQNNTYLIILWLLIEVVGCRFFKFPMQGYFKNQLKYMSKYNMLLIELGERSHSSMGEGWPVEARLLLMSLFNALIFVLVKTLADKISLDDKYTEEISETVNDFLTKGGGKKKEILRMANEATADNPPVPQPATSEPLGGFAPMLGNLLQMFGGVGGGGEEKSEPQKKRPGRFTGKNNSQSSS